jgi:hypothetical protein
MLVHVFVLAAYFVACAVLGFSFGMLLGHLTRRR